jgi:hypothetical protein
LELCRDIPFEQRRQLAAAFRGEATADTDLAEQPQTRTQLKGAKAGATQRTLHATFTTNKFPKAAQDTGNARLLRWLATSAIPFRAVDSPHFLQWVSSIAPNYSPAGTDGRLYVLD